MATEPNNNSQMTPNGNSDTSISTLTLRMIMQGKEAGSIIGKKGDNVKKFREESGAKINISDSSCPERIVTVTGTTDQIFKAFSMICKKFEDDILTNHQNSSLPKPPVTVRLIIPASQCGSLIGKGGAKIKEIREVTGASIQVASEMLPNSTERAVTISGTADAITQCIYHICCVMIESPPKGATIPYRPKPAVPPVIFAGGQAFTLQGQSDLRGGPNMVQFNPGTQPHQIPQLSKVPVQQGMPMPMHHGAMLMPHPGTPAGIIPATSLAQGLHPGAQFPRPQMAAPHQHIPGGGPGQQTHEMSIPNDLIGCIIGRGGAKINEIRQLSGASIKIANSDEGCSDRKVTIMGTPETINAAQYLINASVMSFCAPPPPPPPPSHTATGNHIFGWCLEHKVT